MNCQSLISFRAIGAPVVDGIAADMAPVRGGRREVR